MTWSIDGVVQDLTGWTARMQVRPTISSATVTLDLDSTGGEIVLGGAAGTVTILIAASATAALTAASYVYDLELVDGTEVTALLAGTFVVAPEVTR